MIGGLGETVPAEKWETCQETQSSRSTAEAQRPSFKAVPGGAASDGSWCTSSTRT